MAEDGVLERQLLSRIIYGTRCRYFVGWHLFQVQSHRWKNDAWNLVSRDLQKIRKWTLLEWHAPYNVPFLFTAVDFLIGDARKVSYMLQSLVSPIFKHDSYTRDNINGFAIQVTKIIFIW